MVTRSSATAGELAALLSRLENADADDLRLLWRNHLGGRFPSHLPRWLLIRLLGYRLQVCVHGDLDPALRRRLRQGTEASVPFRVRSAVQTNGRVLTPGTLIVREWKGKPERVMVLEDGFAWNGQTWTSLSQVAKAMTGTHWNGHRFFGLQRKLQNTA